MKSTRTGCHAIALSWRRETGSSAAHGETHALTATARTVQEIHRGGGDDLVGLEEVVLAHEQELRVHGEGGGAQREARSQSAERVSGHNWTASECAATETRVCECAPLMA